MHQRKTTVKKLENLSRGSGAVSTLINEATQPVKKPNATELRSGSMGATAHYSTVEARELNVACEAEDWPVLSANGVDAR
ncbi:hypothetical protein ACTXT7_017637, partial [Hymenolepis weldensis]